MKSNYYCDIIRMTSGKETDDTLDCRGTLCPWPLVKTNEMIEKMSTGQILEVLSTDPAAVPDLQAWAKRTGNKFISSTKEEDVWKIYVKKQ